METRSEGQVADLLERRFRASPRWELVLFEDLPPEQQRRLANAREDDSLYGVLVPRDGGTIKSACTETALLLLTLRAPGRLPGYLTRRPNDLARSVESLVLDGVLEIEIDGRFLGGPTAWQALRPAAAELLGDGPLARLSLDALTYAEELTRCGLPAAEVARRLYAYDRLPRPERRGPQDPRAWLRVDELADQLGRPLAPSHDGSWWVFPQGRIDSGGSSSASRRSEQLVHKLYVSPLPDQLPAALEAAAAPLMTFPDVVFKVAATWTGVSRPDKWVLYLHDRDAVTEVARALQEALGPFEAQGVPFTADAGAGAMVSWGLDPPDGETVSVWKRTESWRGLLTERVATALRDAVDSGVPDPIHFALTRVQLMGIDTRTWTPDRGLWSS